MTKIHTIDTETYFGRFVIDLAFKAVNETEIEVDFNLKTIPKIIRTILPRKVMDKPMTRIESRDQIRMWANRLNDVADMPVEGSENV